MRARNSNAVGQLRQNATVESFLWVLLLLLAAISRLYDLGSRTLHHDESIHTHFSWLLSDQGVYTHNPLSHGPFLFHANALIYTLLGASDVTSRVLPAITGILIVGMPWLLRGDRFLGRWGALTTSFLLLVSPTFVYYTRFIRHDPYMALGTLLLVASIFRYCESAQRRWMLLAFISVGVLLTNHELALATLLMFIVFFWIILLFTKLDFLIPVHVITIVATLIAYVFLANARSLPEIPWQNPTQELTRRFYSELIQNPLVVAMILIVLAFVTSSVFLVSKTANRFKAGGLSPLDGLFGDPGRGTLSFGVKRALEDWKGLGLGLAMMLGICLTLFTTFFTNLNGVATATYSPGGTLLYWLGQHDVRRGEQPWFYFITLGFQYEWLGILLTSAATILVAKRLENIIRGRTHYDRLLFMGLCTWWFVSMFIITSWAGEKMPWLMMHFALPAFLMSGVFIEELIARISTARVALPWNKMTATSTSLIAIALFGCVVSWYLITARLSYQYWSNHLASPSMPATIRAEWWLTSIPVFAILLLIGVGLWRIGPIRTGTVLLAVSVAVASIFQVHNDVRLIGKDGDGAQDTLIYNTVGPDVSQLRDDLEDMSLHVYGDLSMPVALDRCTEWPLNWYLRDFNNMRRVVEPPTDGVSDVIIGTNDSGRGCTMPQSLTGYTAYDYTFRWHEPEQSTYREFAIAPEIAAGRSAWHYEDEPHGLLAIIESVGESLVYGTTPEGQARLFQLLFHREHTAPPIVYPFRVLVRNELVPIYTELRYGLEVHANKFGRYREPQTITCCVPA